jgi:hypothetical protein
VKRVRADPSRPLGLAFFPRSATMARVRRTVASVACVAALLLSGAPTPAQEPAQELPHPPRGLLEGHFATGRACAPCHSGAEQATALKDARGRSVAPFDLWRGTMMANSARDPLWRAQVAAEVAAVPSAARAEVVAECLRCHASMASHEARLRGEPPPGLELLADQGPRGVLARDGASCTTCHQVRDEGLGTEATFSGQLPLGGDDRVIFGPHAAPQPGPMRRFVSYTPTFGPHVLRSSLCATCHTLRTSGFDAHGEPTGRTVLEQGPYLEWRASAFSDEGPTPGPQARTCQGCHLPTTDADGAPIVARIARNPMGRDFPFVEPRAPLGRHLLVGGNVLVPALLRDHPELGAEAPREAFDAVLAAARDQLERRTARVALHGLRLVDGRLQGAMRVENLAGHKLPTGIPVRRTWLRVRVLAGERVALAVGEHDAAGRIIGSGGAPRAEEVAGGPTYPHRAVLDGPDAVQVYEHVLADSDGRPTFRLRRAAGSVKDNRLLPAGFDGARADPGTLPVGTDGDQDFAPKSRGDDSGGAGDVVRLDLPLPADVGPLAVEVALLYQPLGARWAAELFTVDDPAVARFRALYEGADRTPVVLATATARVE